MSPNDNKENTLDVSEESGNIVDFSKAVSSTFSSRELVPAEARLASNTLELS